ncbi:MAG: septum formation initiator family protein [Halanaerobiales bacterium]|nr:septum formation initiator family protein [Halanaerobiales bacterium]
MRIRVRDILASRLFKVLIIFILIFTAYRFYLNQREINRLEREIEQLIAEVNLAEEKQAQLQEEIEHINDLEYIERIARKELGLVKPGELLIIPVEQEE